MNFHDKKKSQHTGEHDIFYFIKKSQNVNDLSISYSAYGNEKKNNLNSIVLLCNQVIS